MRWLAVLLFTLALAIPAAAIPKAVLNTTHRIELVEAFHDVVCSATAIAPHSLLTATHCDLGVDEILIDGIAAKVVDSVSDGQDHTVFIVDATFKHYAKFSFKTLKQGDVVWLRGNPARLSYMVRAGRFAGAQEDRDPNGKPVMDDMFDINGWNGDSGGALFDKHGHIVDVVSFGISEGEFVMFGAYPPQFTAEQWGHLK